MLAQLYAKLADVARTASLQQVSFHESVTESDLKEVEDANARLSEVHELFSENRLYLARNTAEQVDSVLKQIQKPLLDYHITLAAQREHWNNEEWAAKHREAFEPLSSKEFVQAMSSIEDDFRRMLGVDASSSPHPEASGRTR